MGLHPTAANTTDDCVLCCSCAKECPHDAICLDLRYPWMGLVERQTTSLAEVLFAPLLIGAVLAIRLPQVVMLESALLQQCVQFAIVIGGLLLTILVTGLSREKAVRQRRVQHLGSALLPLALSGMFGLFFRELIIDGPKLVPLLIQSFQLDQWLDPGKYRVEPGFLKIVLPLTIVSGAGFSWFLLKRFYRQVQEETPPLIQYGLLLLVAGLFLWWL